MTIELKTSYENFGIECGKGWEPLYKPLMDLCGLYGVQITQIKEKFGRLRFYVVGERSEELELIISAAEHASGHICEDCGVSGTIGFTKEGAPIYKVTTNTSETSGWLRSLCTPCRTAWDAKRRS